MSVEKHRLVLVDVNPLSLCLDCAGTCIVKIPRNTELPCTLKEIYTTTEDNQTSISFGFFQGEHEETTKNTFAGLFVLEDIAPSPQGTPQIELTISIDKNGIVNVSGKNLEPGDECSSSIFQSPSVCHGQWQFVDTKSWEYGKTRLVNQNFF